MSTATANLVGITGITRRLVLDGVLREADARKALDEATKAKKPLDTVKPADLGVDVAPRIRTVKVSEPPARKAGIKVPDVATLVAKLKTEAKVI